MRYSACRLISRSASSGWIATIGPSSSNHVLLDYCTSQGITFTRSRFATRRAFTATTSCGPKAFARGYLSAVMRSWLWHTFFPCILTAVSQDDLPRC